MDAKIAVCGYIEEIDKTITPRTQATKLELDSKLHLSETVKKYEAIVSQLEYDLTHQVRDSVNSFSFQQMAFRFTVDFLLVFLLVTFVMLYTILFCYSFQKWTVIPLILWRPACLLGLVGGVGYVSLSSTS